MKSAAGQAPQRLLNVHGIGDDALGAFGASSKMNNKWGFYSICRRLDGGRLIIGSRRTSPRSATAPRSISRACFRRRMAPFQAHLS